MSKEYSVKFEEDHSFDNELTCPICGDNYTHVRRVSENGGEGNQHFAEIFFWGECGHYFSLCFDGHKGNIYTYFLEKDSVEEKEYEMFVLREEISKLQRENIELKANVTKLTQSPKT